MGADKHIAFVDLQGFIVNQQFVLKELCFLSSLSNTTLNHYIYKPPFSWEFVNDRSKKNIIWLTIFHHGLYWIDGNIPYYKIDETFEQLCSPNLIIYVKGAQKVTWLKNLCKNYIDCRNIEEIGCNFRLADCAQPHLSCSQHKHKTNNCALQSVKLISNWYNNATKR